MRGLGQNTGGEGPGTRRPAGAGRAATVAEGRSPSSPSRSERGSGPTRDEAGAPWVRLLGLTPKDEG